MGNVIFAYLSSELEVSCKILYCFHKHYDLIVTECMCVCV